MASHFTILFYLNLYSIQASERSCFSSLSLYSSGRLSTFLLSSADLPTRRRCSPSLRNSTKVHFHKTFAPLQVPFDFNSFNVVLFVTSRFCFVWLLYTNILALLIVIFTQATVLTPPTLCLPSPLRCLSTTPHILDLVLSKACTFERALHVHNSGSGVYFVMTCWKNLIYSTIYDNRRQEKCDTYCAPCVFMYCLVGLYVLSLN